MVDNDGGDNNPSPARDDSLVGTTEILKKFNQNAFDFVAFPAIIP
jgi:hypothetical protein